MISVMEYTSNMIPASNVIVIVEVIGFVIRMIPHSIMIIDIMNTAIQGESLMFRMLIASLNLIRLFRINHIPRIMGIIIFSISG